jgi:hypothetical protein
MFRILILSVSFFTLSCNAKLNQLKQGKEHGKWIITTPDSTVSKGRFRNGREVGTWKQINQGKLYKKEHYKCNESYVKFYHPNGEVKARGKTQLTITDETLHWYYTGKWFYYNEKGELIETRDFPKKVN